MYWQLSWLTNIVSVHSPLETEDWIHEWELEKKYVSPWFELVSCLTAFSPDWLQDLVLLLLVAKTKDTRPITKMFKIGNACIWCSSVFI